tara:strand:+ start:1196 stop:1645 length:450 start_codon:yes stop_codon:yes gene_type:complete
MDIRKRMNNHKADCNKIGVDNSPKYVFIRNTGGLDNWKMEILETITADCDTISLRKCEQHWINLISPALNGTPAYKTADEKKLLRRSLDKKYYEEHADKISDYQKQYTIDNREKISAKAKEKIMCSCGVIYSRANKTRHLKTKYHIANA